MSEVNGAAHELWQRRRARQLVSNRQTEHSIGHGPDPARARIRRGPERSRDEAITPYSGPRTYSVASSGDDDHHTAVSMTTSNNLTTYSDPRGSNGTPQRSEQRNIESVASTSRPSPHLRRMANMLRRSVLGQDLADNNDDPDEVTRQHSSRRYRPHSWSDSMEGAAPPLTIQPRRTIRQDFSALLCRSSSASSFRLGIDGTHSTHTRSHSEIVGGSVDESSRSSISESASVLQASICTPNSDEDSAVAEVMSAASSPLDTLSYEGFEDHIPQTAWTCDLPIRTGAPYSSRQIRFPDFSTSSDEESPTSPDFEEGYMLTPRPRQPRSPLFLPATVPPVTTSVSPYQIPPESNAGFLDNISSLLAGAERNGEPRGGSEASSQQTQQRIRRRPLPSPSSNGLSAGNTTHSSSGANRTSPSSAPARPVPQFTDAEFREQLLLRQQASFYRDLALDNNGNIPEDAHTQWLGYARRLMATSTPSRDQAQRSHGFRRGPQRADAILQPSESAGNRGLTDPFEPTTSSESMERADPRGMGLEFAVARGGRPRLETVWRAPVQGSRTNWINGVNGRDYASRGSSFDQENIDGGEAWSRFEQERSRVLRNAAAGTGSSEGATPPSMGRLGRYM